MAVTAPELIAGRVLVVGCGTLAADLCALGVEATSDDAVAAVRAASDDLSGIDLIIVDRAAEGLIDTLAQAFPALLTLVLDPDVGSVRVSASRGPAQDAPVVRVPEHIPPVELLRWIRAAASRRPPRPLF